MSFSRFLVAAVALSAALFTADPVRAQGCVTGLTPNPLVVPANGAAVTVTVQTATPDCQWAVGNIPVWLHFPDQFGGVGPGTVRFSRPMPNHGGAPRTNPGSVLIGGVALPLEQPGNPCPLTISPSVITSPANGGAGSFTVNTSGSSCSYAVSPGDGITITSGQSGSTFPATVSFTIAPNTLDQPQIRSLLVSSLGTFLFAPGFGILQNGPPIVTDAPRGELTFAIYRPVTGPEHVSPSEPIQVTNTEDPDAQWTVTTSQPWLLATPAAGATPQTLTFSIDQAAAASLPIGRYVAHATFFSAVAPVTPRFVDVTLMITGTFSITQPPGGVVDTPAQGASGLSGAVAVTGWAIDDVGIARVQIYRNHVDGEPPTDIYLGDATRVRGARPDIVEAHALDFIPQLTRAGWGFMILSNMLPGGGNGTFLLKAVAEDIEGHRVTLGERMVTFDNATSVFPFGTIDRPIQGGVMSGTSYFNQGWVLAQQDRLIPPDGSTLRLLIDGVVQPNVASYNHARPDVAGLFPNPPYLNSGGPAAQFTIDTTQFTNGIHTIVWTATDNLGVTQGIGSRYVDIQNPQGAITEPLAARSEASLASVPLATAFVWDRTGFDDRDWSLQFAGTRTREIKVRHGERLEIAIDTWIWSAGCGAFAGYVKNGDVAGPLPPGASLDGEQGMFRWMPPAEFSGTFDFTFVRRTCDGGEERIPLRITIEP